MSLRLTITASLLVLVVATAAVFALADSVESEIVATAAVACVALAFGAWLSQWILLPLRELTDAARRIAAGDNTARVQTVDPREMGSLVSAFNDMVDTVQRRVATASQERGRLAAALNSSVDAVVAVNAEGLVLYANNAAERLFQHQAREIVGRPFAWTLPNDAVIEAIRASRERMESIATLIERPGRRYLQVVTNPIGGGGDWSILVVFHDLTEVRRTDQIRRDFVANVGHELRTPLAAIKSVVDTLQDGAINEPEVAREFLSRADAEVERLVQMVEELMELSRIESGVLPLNVEPVNIATLVGEVLNRLLPQAERKEISLNLMVDPGVEFPLDARRIEHAIVNLVHNAIKFTPDGGSIVVNAERDSDGLAVRVSDNGIGIAREDLSRIFERFYKVDQSRASVGSGLGLAVVKHTVEAHGGTVRAESGPGPGSTFTIMLPLKPGSRA
jgi:two-component system phosphate regulon sensor histidine kinase PhoR